MNKHEIVYGKSPLSIVHLVLTELSNIVQSSRENSNSHYDRGPINGIEDEVSFSNQLMSSRAHGHLFSAALRIVQWRRMLSRNENMIQSVVKTGEQ